MFAVGIGDKLHHAGRFAEDLRAGDGREGEDARAHTIAELLARLLLGEADAGDLRDGEDAVGDHRRVVVRLVPLQVLDDDLALHRRGVRQLRHEGDVADRVDAGEIGARARYRP